MDRYKLAERHLSWNAFMQTNNQILKIGWIKDSAEFWYIRYSQGKFEFLLCDPIKKEIKPAFDQKKLAQSLSVVLSRPINENMLPIFNIEYTRSMDAIEFNIGGYDFGCDLSSYQVSPIKIDQIKKNPSENVSPDEKWGVFSKDFNLCLRNYEENSIKQITFDGIAHFTYGAECEDNDNFISNKLKGKMTPPIVVWSPDSSKFIVCQVDYRKVQDFPFYQSIHEGNSVFPQLHYVKFRTAVDPNVCLSNLFVCDVTAGTMAKVSENIPVPISNPINFNLAWWDAQSENIFMIQMERYFQKYSLVKFNIPSREMKTLFAEEAETFVNIHFNNPLTYFAEKQNLIWNSQMIWWSQKDNWGHLYLIDLNSGTWCKQLTRGEWNVNEVLEVNFESNYVIFIGNGREKEADPYYCHLYKLDLTNLLISNLTPIPADHMIIWESRENYFIDIVSTIAQTPNYVLRDKEGKEIMVLENVDIGSLQQQGWTWPEAFKTKSADKKYDIYGTIFKPIDFDPSQKYPIIDYVYGGLQKIHAPKAFPVSQDINNLHIYWTSFSLAQLGFIVVTIDGRGTPFRSKEFQDYCYKDIAHDQGLADHVRAIKSLAESRPWLDLDRVGIFGHSAGGSVAARGLISFGDFYNVAVSSAAVYDNLLDQSSWIETYLGPFEADLYSEQNIYSHADKISGKLLIVCGEMDENVPFSNALKMQNAMIEAGKDVDFLIMPNSNHWYVYHPFFYQKYWNYFVQHLLGKIPSSYTIQPMHPALKLLFDL